MEWICKNLHPRYWLFWFYLLRAMLVPCAVVATLAVLFGLYLGYVTDHLWGFLGLDSARLDTASKVVALVILFLIADTLYHFKRDSQKWYGAVEIAFALGFAWRVLSSQLIQDRYQNAVALVAATYLLSRGIANYVEGGGRIQLVPRFIRTRAERFASTGSFRQPPTAEGGHGSNPTGARR